MALYRLVKPLLFRLDPELVHEHMLRRLSMLQRSAAGRALLRVLAGMPRRAPVSVLGLSFDHPVGLAAGFDKNAEVVLAMQELGFSHVEIGTVTPRPQPGNAKPRIWRFPEAQALVNALGFPGQGMHAVAANLLRVRETGLLRIPIGINIGKNADTDPEQAVHDFSAVLDHLYELGDYFVVNVSSPNTSGLRDLQAVDSLRLILAPLMELDQRRGGKPVLVKIAPDLNNADITAIARLTRELGLAGIVAGNTTVRRQLVPRAAALERGGLSGAPLYPRTLEVVSLLRSGLSASQTIVAAGGIGTSQQVRSIVRSGASLVDLYTALVYLGPGCVKCLVTST
ncbi:quinone-dependent dihydroorotate dehydrogenase [candidate division KSB1 bacterium]|nr:quinone-dependent dihydroorotate dehydrogenase [candidate division KSB1 bacterium]